MVLYRKHRPQTLDALVGQDQVKQALKAALASGKLSHAYLFCGPRGTGKTSTARILAKMVNCEGQIDQLPCNQCSSCLAISDSSSLDVVEMDAASNRGIEDIRNLRENIKLAPSSSKKKVYIIDEVHMLSGDAFNAFLKTLEEPPSHVLFVLATTEVQKIPPTILSRVSRLDFKLASAEELKEALKRVAEAEKIVVSDEALISLAKKAQGSFRDGIKFLDQLSNLGKIDVELVEKNLGTGFSEGILLLLESVAKADAPEALKKLLRQIDQGAQTKELTLSILDTLRELILIKNGLGEQLVKVEIGEEKYQGLAKLAEKFELEKLLEMVHHFQKSLEYGRFVSISSLPLELAVVESCRGRVKNEEGADEVKKEKEVVIPQVAMDSKGEIMEKVNTLSSPKDPSQDPDIKKIIDKWSYVLETVRQFNYSLEALLRTAKLVECNQSQIIMEVPYSFHQRILEAPKSRDLLESIFADILGRSLKISTVLGQRPQNREELQNIEVAADDEIVRIASEIFNSDQVN
ncbi:MAG: DNA polymerase III subunit gamma/tau [bacterium]|nr:DNA polymerase III subunit gamma/tau [bacterium]